MRTTILTALVLFVSLTGLALASGPSGPSSAARDSFAEQDALTVTETIHCVVTEIRRDGTVLIKDSEQKAAHQLAYSKKTRFVAQDKHEFDGRKKLQVADLEIGRELRVTVRPATMEVVRVKVLKKKS